MKLSLHMILGTFAISVLAACGNENPEMGNHELTDEETVIEESNGVYATEDQLDLEIGDTGVIRQTIGTFELTVESAEFMEAAQSEDSALLDEVIVLELTFKNIGDNTLNAEEVLNYLQLTGGREDSDGNHERPNLEIVEVLDGELQPGEVKTTKFKGHVHSSDAYYFIVNEGAESTNQVMWTIPDGEVRN